MFVSEWSSSLVVANRLLDMQKHINTKIGILDYNEPQNVLQQEDKVGDKTCILLLVLQYP